MPDMVDRMLAAVSGDDDDYVGLQEVGLDRAAIAARQRNRRAAMAAGQAPMTSVPGTPPSPVFARSSRDTLRRASGGFVQFSLAAAIGAVATNPMKVSRVVHIDRLLIIPSAPGIVIDSIKVGDEEQLLQPGVPVELYGTAALTDTLPDNFSPLQSGIDLVITLRNTTAGALTALIGVKGSVER